MQDEQFALAMSCGRLHLWWDNDDIICFVIEPHAEFFFIVMAHWNNSSKIDTSQHAVALF